MRFARIRKKNRNAILLSLQPRYRHRTIWWQIAKMRAFFPQFTRTISHQSVMWVGTLTPKNHRYTIQIDYKEHKFPIVHVLDPLIPDDAPHIYRTKNNALCLFYPKHNEWTPNLYISDTIVPWTVEWLRFYEIWKITDEWFGPEAPHPVGEPKDYDVN